ncbi:MAG: GNAT family N-acetyltransferase [Armatimonadetes bacterium]|nr:GNAT family N-acetyltransferase [Armatimonadota bacterium]
MIIHAPRITLRPFHADDWEWLLRVEGTSENARFQNYEPRDEENARKYAIEASEKGIGQGNPVWFEFVIQVDGTAIGRIGAIADEHPLQFRVWYSLDPTHGGKGFATEALQTILVFAFEVMQMHRVFAYVDSRNTSSRRLCERARLRFEAELVEDYELKGEWTNTCFYAMLRREYCQPFEIQIIE